MMIILNTKIEKRKKKLLKPLTEPVQSNYFNIDQLHIFHHMFKYTLPHYSVMRNQLWGYILENTFKNLGMNQ